MRRAAIITVLTGLASLGLMMQSGPASAHEERDVGPYTLAVGFGHEPAYAGFENSVQLFLHDSKDRPVTDLGDTLKVDVIFGSSTMTLSMEPFFEEGEFGTPGDYRAFFIPTRPGSYTFHLTGSIKGKKVDERFTSSPTTFDSVVDPQQAEFPAKDPTQAQLAERLEQEIPRLQAQIKDASDSAKSAAGTARLLGIVALVLAVIAVALAAMGMRRRRTVSG